MKSVTAKIRRSSRRLKDRFRRSRHGPVRAASPAQGGPIRPRVLILSASVGSGHIRAAKAIESAFNINHPHVAVTHVDVLQLTNAPFRRAYGAGYFRAAQRAPRLVGMLYDFLDRPGEVGATTPIRHAFERANFHRLKRLLCAQQWDLVINTHFLSAAMIARLRRGGVVSFPHVTVVTDYDIHGMWIHEPIERMFVATEEIRINAIAEGVPAEQLCVTGIPIDPLFSESRDRRATIAKLGLDPIKPIVLQLAGGFGVGSIEKIHEMILDIERPIQVIVVSGKNQAVRTSLTAMPWPSRHTRQILGYTNQMHELLCAADVVVSKPGGLTTSECLASGCAMVVAEPIPGQEERNADFLLESGCAIKVNNLASLTLKLQSLLADAPRLAAMREKARQSGKPRAAFDVAKICNEMLISPKISA
jgi:processive 1,2-diacylglycerol beta-glucosyltransferase